MRVSDKQNETKQLVQEYARGQKTVPHGTWKSPPHGSLDDICVFVIDLAAVSSCPFESNGDDFDDQDKKHDTKRRKDFFRRYTFSPEKLTQNGIPISKSTRMPKSKSTKINALIYILIKGPDPWIS